jgi:Flp pilus assembly protein TadD
VAVYNQIAMKATIGAITSSLLVMLGSLAPLLAQAPVQQQQPDFIKQGQQLIRDGKPEEALALYRQTLQTSPNSLPANIAAGSVLDLMGKGAEARKYFTKAIDVADTPEGKASVKRAMALSYAFEGKSRSGSSDHAPCQDGHDPLLLAFPAKSKACRAGKSAPTLDS